MGRVSTYICGDAGPGDEYNPFKVTQQEHVPEILFLLNLEPLTVDELSKRLGVSVETVSKLLQDLFRINAVFERDEKWQVSFPIFTKQDIRLVSEKTRKPALRLAEEIMRMGSRLKEHLARLSCAKQVENDKIMLAIVGCFILDWKALEVLNEKDLTLCGRKQQPGGRKYVLLGREEGAGEGLYDRMYWGSHSNKFGRIIFTSFGDHTGCRYAFPDLAWNLYALTRRRESGMPDWFWVRITETLNVFQTNCMLELGRILLLLNSEGPMSTSLLREKLMMEREQAESLVKLLASMKYVFLNGEKVRLNYPVFTAEDKRVIEDVWKTVSGIVEKEACEYFNSLQTELAEITPIRKGIDPREIYTDVWHWVFGCANRIMAERGFFFDPPKEREGEGRYIAWIEEDASH
jgi:DNA-binding transcriptional regulator GbsR (MarR family)